MNGLTPRVLKPERTGVRIRADNRSFSAGGSLSVTKIVGVNAAMSHHSAEPPETRSMLGPWGEKVEELKEIFNF
jgi:hypothetical protein